MRAMRVALAVGFAIVAAGGCHPNDTGAVLLHFTERVDMPSAMTTFSSSTAAVAFDPAGPVLFTATSNQGTLRLVLAGPLVDGATIALPADEERVRFELDGAAWGNQGGTVEVLSANPAIVRLAGVPMVARGGGAAGSFVFDGAGTFR